jgi:hypothetical protein
MEDNFIVVFDAQPTTLKINAPINAMLKQNEMNPGFFLFIFILLLGKS